MGRDIDECALGRNHCDDHADCINVDVNKDGPVMDTDAEKQDLKIKMLMNALREQTDVMQTPSASTPTQVTTVNVTKDMKETVTYADKCNSQRNSQPASENTKK